MGRWGRILLAATIMVAVMFTGAQGYQVKIGARISTGLFYAFMTGSSYGNRDKRMPDLTSFVAQIGDGMFYTMFHSDDRRTGVHVQVTILAGPDQGASRLVPAYMYGWYKFGRCRVEIGHVDNLFAASTYAPYAALGGFTMPGGSGGFYDFGKLYSGRFEQIALYYDLPRWTFMVALGWVPNNTTNPPTYRGGVGLIVGHGTWPRLDVALEYRAKNFSVAPGLSVYMSRWESMEGVSLRDDHVWSFCLVLPFRFVYKNFGFTGELGFGKNWVTSNMLNAWQAATWWGGANDRQDQNKAADTYLYSACLGFFFRMGRVTLWLSGGWKMTQNGGSDAPGTWRHGQNVRYAFVFAAPYQVNRHFTIAPEVAYYFYGWDPTQDVGGSRNPDNPTSMTADLGGAWLIGVRLVISF